MASVAMEQLAINGGPKAVTNKLKIVAPVRRARD